MRFTRVSDWLRWQERLHPREIDLGLERVARVADRLGLQKPSAVVMTVGGTNGKGTTVAVLEALAIESGRLPGTYTSPHLLRYNERIRLGGRDCEDDRLLCAFNAVDCARGTTRLTYFEFGTLAALWCFRDAGCDPWILEVGLGGRLDAVNILDPDVAAITSIDLDHADWLGTDRDAIAREKAGILRSGRPAICGDDRPPAALFEAADGADVELQLRGRHYDGRRDRDGWCWSQGASRWSGLPMPAPGPAAMQDAATALAAWQAATRLPPMTADTARRALAAVHLRGRFERLAPDWLLDVAHNPAAARSLASALTAEGWNGSVHAVFGLMRRKDLHGVIAALAPSIDTWHLLLLPDEPAWSTTEVIAEIEMAGGRIGRVGSAAALLPELAKTPALKVAFGSFQVVAEVMRWHESGCMPSFEGPAASGGG